MSTEIRLLNVCRTLATATTQVYSDQFDGTAMSADWAAGGWTLANIADSGLPSVGEGWAKVTNAQSNYELRTALLDSQSMATTAYREVSIAWGGGPGSRVWVMLDMADSSPNPNTGGYMATALFSNTSGDPYGQLLLYRDGVAVAAKIYHSAIPRSGGARYYLLRLSIDGSNLVRVYFANSDIPDLTYQPSAYTAVGGQVGFALMKSPYFFGTTVTWFKLVHAGTSVGEQPAHMLVMSKNGSFYYESTNGNMIQLDTTTTLASDHWISSAPHLQKVYIADYALRTKNTAATATTSASTLTDTGADFVTDAVDAQDDLLDVTDGTGVTLGTYPISSVTDATNVVVTGTLGTGSGVSYRIIRAPKVFDSGALTLTRLTASAGFVPPGCNIVAACFDRVCWAGDDDLPEAVYLSKVGDPTDYNYGVDTTDQARVFDPARASGSATVGDEVTALIPHQSDYLVIGCKRSIYIQRGDPGLGNTPEIVTRQAGIISQSAWCYTPEGYIVAMTQDGLYQFAPSPDTVPTKLSRDRLPEELTNLNTDLVDVNLEYNIQAEGINIFVTPVNPGPTNHWFYGWRTKSFHRDHYPETMEPTATTTHALSGQGSPRVILGGRDGYLRVFTDDRPDDDGENFDSFVLIGPILLGGSGYHDGIVREVIGQLAALSGDVTLEIQVGDSIESAYNAAPRDAFTLKAGKNLTHSPRLRGNACFLRLSSTGGTAWAMEQLSVVREQLGKQRVL